MSPHMSLSKLFLVYFGFLGSNVHINTADMLLVICSVLPVEIVSTVNIEIEALPILFYICKFLLLWSLILFFWNFSRYADFLCKLNDDRNVRALFERALSLLPSEKSVEVW
jgi:Suppressor of forked protein (Suf)